MTAITIKNFGGIAPRIPPRYLADNQAQIAVNCPTWLGSLKSLRDTSYIQDFSKEGVITSIYRFGDTLDSETQYWFHWTGDYDVVRGFINGDTSERTFFTGTDVIPQATDNVLALAGGGTSYPNNAYMLGVPPPETELTATIGDEPPQDGAVKETRVYTWTVVNQWDEESAPFTEVTDQSTVDVETGQTVLINFPSTPSGNYVPKARRLYRAVTGVYLFVAEIPIASASYTDSIAPDELNEEMSSLTWLTPPEDLQGLIGLPGGVLAGFTGIDVYFSVPYRPFAWPIQYQQSVSSTIVGISNIDTTVVVLTTGKPVFFQGFDPGAMVLVEADISQACVSKNSILSMNGFVFYASPDGLVALSPGGSRVVTAGVYDKEQWQQLKPESIRAYVYENRYVAFYDTGVTQGGFIYDGSSGSFTTHNMFATAGYNDLKNDALYLSVNNDLHKWDSGSALTYTWRSKKYTFPDLVAFTCFRVNAESYPITFSIYRDGVIYHTQTISDSEIKRLPGGYGHDYEIELTGQGEVYSVQVGQSPREIANG